MKLVYKLIIMSAIIGIPLVLSNVIFIGMTQNELEQNVREKHLDRAKYLAARTDAFFEEAESRIESLFITHDIDEMGPLELEEFLTPLVGQFDSVRIITVLDNEMKPEALLLDPAVISPDDFVLHVASVPDAGHEDYEKHAAIAREGSEKNRRRIFRSEVYAGRGGDRLLMTIARPFPGGGRTLGVELSLERVEEIFAGVKTGRADSGEAYLVDGRGMLVAHTDPARALAREDMSGIEAVRDMLGREFQIAADFTGPDGEEMLGAFYSAYEAAGGWHVVVQEPRRDAYYAARVMRVQAGIAVLVSIIFAAAAGLFITSTITRPLYRLVYGADEIGSGNLEHKVDNAGGGEMAILADSFNHMGSSLSAREHAIERINRTAKIISAIIDRQQLADTALHALEGIANTRVISIAIMGSDEPEPAIRAIVDGREAGPDMMPDFFEREIRRAAASGEQLLIDDDADAQLPPDCLPAVLMPVTFEDRTKGVIALAGLSGKDAFTHTDLHLYSIVASAVAVSVQNIELLEQAVEKTRMEEELKTARLIQNTLFPRHPPAVPGLDLAGFIQSASETGGDWYGFVHEPENRRIAIIIADVTGHGVPAAIVTATTYSFFKTLEIFRTGAAYDEDDMRRDSAGKVLKGGGFFDPLSPDFMLRCLNRIILESTDGQLVMTLFASVYYYDTGVLEYANAGHNLPLIYRPGGFGGKKKKKTNMTYIKARGMRLGDDKEVSYKVRRMQLSEGDAILWYTDGLVECANSEGVEFGMDRLKAIFEENAAREAAEVRNVIVGEAGRFYGDMAQEDDITFVVGRVTEIAPREDALAAESESSGEAPVIGNAVLAAGSQAFRKQIAWLMGGYGIEVKQYADSVEGLEKHDSSNHDLCIMSLGGVMEDLGFATQLAVDRPGAGMLFLCPSEFDAVIPIISEQGFPLTLVKAGGEYTLHMTQLLLRKMIEPQRTAPGLAHFLSKGAAVKKLLARDTYTRMEDMQPLFDLASDSGWSGHELNRVMSIVDELLMNAMFDAPVDGAGNHKYADADRTKRIVLGEDEAPVVEYGTDGDFLGICVTDPFGGLAKETILKYLEKRIFSREKNVDHSRGGAGLGLYHLYRLCDHLIFYVVPGGKTEAICLLNGADDYKTRKMGISTLSYIDGGS